MSHPHPPDFTIELVCGPWGRNYPEQQTGMPLQFRNLFWLLYEGIEDPELHDGWHEIQDIQDLLYGDLEVYGFLSWVHWSPEAHGFV